jgi:cyclin-dependent kinase-like
MQSKYEVIGIVGRGAYGVVYKCKNKETGEFVALKKFKEIEDDLVKKTMMRELKVLQMLKHDNIVEYKEAFKTKGDLFLVFEYVDKNLLELLQEHPRGLDPLVIKKIIYQLCKAIKYLHDMNIVHRDIKPENLLIDSNLKLKLCDFGFSRTIKKNNDRLTDYVATRWYRSPELLITSGYYGSEVDYWAIGCIMGELADGDPLFPGDNELDQLAVIQKVLGKLPDHQQELFYNNPNFKGRKLPDVSKPETLEKRYLGKLSKQAINFMKALINPDPKYRLKGDAVFNHSFFDNYPDPFPSSSVTQNPNQKNFQTNNTSGNNNNNSVNNNSINTANNITPITVNNFSTSNNQPTTSSVNHNNNSNFPQNIYLIPSRENNNHPIVNSTSTNNNNNHKMNNTSTNPIHEQSVNLTKHLTQNHQQDKKSNIVHPIITNTTNINIINYNNFDGYKNQINTSSHNILNQAPIVIQKRSNKNFENEKNYLTEKLKNLNKKSFNQNKKTNILPHNEIFA